MLASLFAFKDNLSKLPTLPWDKWDTYSVTPIRAHRDTSWCCVARASHQTDVEPMLCSKRREASRKVTWRHLARKLLSTRMCLPRSLLMHLYIKYNASKRNNNCYANQHCIMNTFHLNIRVIESKLLCELYWNEIFTTIHILFYANSMVFSILFLMATYSQL